MAGKSSIRHHHVSKPVHGEKEDEKELNRRSIKRKIHTKPSYIMVLDPWHVKVTSTTIMHQACCRRRTKIMRMRCTDDRTCEKHIGDTLTQIRQAATTRTQYRWTRFHCAWTGKRFCSAMVVDQQRLTILAACFSSQHMLLYRTRGIRHVLRFCLNLC